MAPIRTLLADALLRAVAALETPADLTREEIAHVIEDGRIALDRHEAEVANAPEIAAALSSLEAAAEPVYRKARFIFIPMDRALKWARQALDRLDPATSSELPASLPVDSAPSENIGGCWRAEGVRVYMDDDTCFEVDQAGTIPEQEALRLARQITASVNYCRGMPIDQLEAAPAPGEITSIDWEARYRLLEREVMSLRQAT